MNIIYSCLYINVFADFATRQCNQCTLPDKDYVTGVQKPNNCNRLLIGFDFLAFTPILE